MSERLRIARTTALLVAAIAEFNNFVNAGGWHETYLYFVSIVLGIVWGSGAYLLLQLIDQAIFLIATHTADPAPPTPPPAPPQAPKQQPVPRREQEHEVVQSSQPAMQMRVVNHSETAVAKFQNILIEAGCDLDKIYIDKLARAVHVDYMATGQTALSRNAMTTGEEKFMEQRQYGSFLNAMKDNGFAVEGDQGYEFTPPFYQLMIACDSQLRGRLQRNSGNRVAVTPEAQPMLQAI